MLAMLYFVLIVGAVGFFGVPALLCFLMFEGRVSRAPPPEANSVTRGESSPPARLPVGGDDQLEEAARALAAGWADSPPESEDNQAGLIPKSCSPSENTWPSSRHFDEA